MLVILDSFYTCHPLQKGVVPEIMRIENRLFFQDNIWTKKMTFELVIFNFNHKLYVLQLADLLLISIYDANLMFALIKHHPFLQMI